MGKPLALLACWLGLTVGLWAGGVQYGMNRGQIEAALGKPIAVLNRGPRLILLYPGRGRVELERGVVVSLVGVAADDGTPEAAVAAAAKAASISEEDIAEIDARQRAEKIRLENRRLIEETRATLAGSHDKELLTAVRRPREFWSGLAAGLFVRALVTVGVLKLAFLGGAGRAGWGQLILSALADTITQAATGAAAFALWRADHVFYLDVAVSYFVLAGVLWLTTRTCTLGRAAAVAGIAKLVSFALWALIWAVFRSLQP